MVEALDARSQYIPAPYFDHPTGETSVDRRDFHTSVAVVTDTMITRVSALDGGVPPEVRRRIEELEGGVSTFKDVLKCANLQATLAAIEERYRVADSRSFNTDDRIIRRIAALGGRVHGLLDVDDTLTDSKLLATLHFARGDGVFHYQEELIPGSRVGRRVKSAYGFPFALAVAWGDPLKEQPELFRWGGQLAPLRHGIRTPLFTYFRREGIPVDISSANFKPFVDGVFDQIPEAGEVIDQVFAIHHDDMRADDKETVVQVVSAKRPDRALFYLGDGETDKPAVAPQARRVVAFYGALEGSSLAYELEQTGAPYFTFQTGIDIHDRLQHYSTSAQRVASSYE